MYKTINLDGKEYYLVPTEEVKMMDKSSQERNTLPDAVSEESASKKEVFNDILDDYTGKSEEIVKKAEPKVSDYRERFKKHKIFLSEVMTQPKVLPKLPKQDNQLDQFDYKGEKLFFGEGIEQEF